MFDIRMERRSLIKNLFFKLFLSFLYNSLESFDPRGQPQSRPVVITIFTQIVRPW